MVPKFEASLSPTLPIGLAYWTPSPSDLSDEGFGCFRDTWTIGRLTKREAKDQLEADRALVQLADRLADSADTYEQVAGAIESGDLEDLPDPLRGALAPFAQELADGSSDLAGLELGVSGLVAVIASIGGCFTAASCRAHVGGHTWSPYPVVLLAADQFRSEQLATLVADTGCGFATDAARPELLVIGATSVESMLDLGERILQNHRHFARPRAQRAERLKQVPSRQREVEQGEFDLGTA